VSTLYSGGLPKPTFSRFFCVSSGHLPRFFCVSFAPLFASFHENVLQNRLKKSRDFISGVGKIMLKNILPSIKAGFDSRPRAFFSSFFCKRVASSTLFVETTFWSQQKEPPTLPVIIGVSSAFLFFGKSRFWKSSNGKYVAAYPHHRLKTRSGHFFDSMFFFLFKNT
jgi:hypothetical protein